MAVLKLWFLLQTRISCFLILENAASHNSIFINMKKTVMANNPFKVM